MIEWISVPIRELLLNIKTGSTPSTSEKKFFNGTIPWFTPVDIGNEIWLSNSKRTISEEAIKQGKAKLFEKGMILITCIGNIGRVGILNMPASANQQITAIKFCKEIDTLFAYYWFTANQSILESNANLAIVPILNNEQLLSVHFQYPNSLIEQKRIAAMLLKAEHLRRLHRYERQLSDGYLQSVFLEMFGDLQSNPKCIKVYELREVCKRITDGTHLSPKWSYKGVPFLFVSNVNEGKLNFSTKKFIAHETWKELNRRCPVEVNDILYTIVGSYGKAAIVKTNRPFSFQRHIAHIKPDSIKISPDFLIAMLNTPIVKKQADQLVNGVAQKTLNLKELETIKIFVPTKKEQDAFISIQNKFEIVRNQQIESERQTEQLFNSLLHQAFQGEL